MNILIKKEKKRHLAVAKYFPKKKKEKNDIRKFSSCKGKKKGRAS